MKKLLTITMLLITAILFAQPADINALIKSTGEDVKAQKYTKALSSVEQVKTELNRLLGDQYLALLPAKMQGWETKPEPPKAGPSKTGAPMPMQMMNDNLASRTFTRKDTSKLPPPQAPPMPNDSAYKAKFKQPADTAGKGKMKMPNMPANTSRTNSVTITVSRNAMQANTIVKAHDSAVKQNGKGVEAIMIKGTKATQTYNAYAQYGSLLLLLGPGTVLEVRGNGVKSADELMQFVNALTLDKLTKLAEE